MNNVISQFQSLYTQFKPGNTADFNTIYSEQCIFIDPLIRLEGISFLQDYLSQLTADLSHFAIKFFDQAEEQVESYTNAFARWQLSLSHPHLKKGKIITMDGATFIKAQDTIFFQQNYYDLGAAVYENTPLLGYLIKLVKDRIAQFK